MSCSSLRLEKSVPSSNLWGMLENIWFLTLILSKSVFIAVAPKVSYKLPTATQAFLSYSSSSSFQLVAGSLGGHVWSLVATLLFWALLGDYGIQTGPFDHGSALLLIFKSWRREEVSLINFVPVASSSAFTNAYFRCGFSNDFTSRIRAKSEV